MKYTVSNNFDFFKVLPPVESNQTSYRTVYVENKGITPAVYRFLKVSLFKKWLLFLFAFYVFTE